jgi:5-methylcytosine-specific restriction endonuclease McrA
MNNETKKPSKEKQREYAARYYRKHKARALAATRKWQAKNRVKLNDAAAKFREKHRDSILARRRAWRKENPSLAKQRDRKYREKYYSQRLANNAARRALRKNASVGDVGVIKRWVARWRSKSVVACYWCGGRQAGSMCHVDHIVPLSMGGKHSIENLAISCPDCNIKKHAAHPSVWNLTLNQPVFIFGESK